MKDSPEARQARKKEFIRLAESSGLTQKKIADICEVEAPTISQILNGDEFPGRGTLKLLRRELELMGMEDSALRETSRSADELLWRRRAKDAETRLHHLRTGLKDLLDKSSVSTPPLKQINLAGRAEDEATLDALERAEPGQPEESLHLREAAGPSVPTSEPQPRGGRLSKAPHVPPKPAPK